MPTINDFLDTYKPVLHADNDNLALIEDYNSAKNRELINSTPLNRVWTLCDEDGLFVAPGIHYVNRIGYFIATVDRPENDETIYYEEEVDLDELDDYNPDDGPDYEYGDY